jgi:hypothetical protein
MKNNKLKMNHFFLKNATGIQNNTRRDKFNLLLDKETGSAILILKPYFKFQESITWILL